MGQSDDAILIRKTAACLAPVIVWRLGRHAGSVHVWFKTWKTVAFCLLGLDEMNQGWLQVCVLFQAKRLSARDTIC
jgi:hypothetical protein